MTQQILSLPGDSLRKAVQWISSKKQEQPDLSMSSIIDQAGYNFDLSPKDLDFLSRKLDDKKNTND
ncbi:MAG: hypothetical protein HQK75_01465 [Candidatus Magnetomorum sp.]|nr:hypothetical protein [Candidatus Magnetomorum sp.]